MASNRQEHRSGAHVAQIVMKPEFYDKKLEKMDFIVSLIGEVRTVRHQSNRCTRRNNSSRWCLRVTFCLSTQKIVRWVVPMELRQQCSLLCTFCCGIWSMRSLADFNELSPDSFFTRGTGPFSEFSSSNCCGAKGQQGSTDWKHWYKHRIIGHFVDFYGPF